METRNTSEAVSFVETEDDSPGILEGYGVRYYNANDPGTEFVRKIKGIEVRERVFPGAFTSSLRDNDLRSFWNHETGLILGRQSAGTLEVREDDRGVFYRVKLPNTTAGRDAAESVRRGDVDGSSFGFNDLAKKPILRRGDGFLVREIRNGDLKELSPTPIQAYGGSSVTITRSLEETVEEELSHWKELEQRAKSVHYRKRRIELGLR